MSTGRDPNWVPYEYDTAEYTRSPLEKMMFETIGRAASIFIEECEDPMVTLAEYIHGKPAVTGFNNSVYIIKVNR